MGGILLRRETPSLELGLVGTFAVNLTLVSLMATQWGSASCSWSLPRRELISGSHVLHNLLERLLFLDVHLEAEVALASPVVDHGEQDATSCWRRVWGKNKSSAAEFLSDTCCRCCAP